MPDQPQTDRLDSWKEIAAFLRRDVTTVQRWEKREGMPVHRHRHDKMGSVWASRAELDAWARSRSLADGADGEPAALASDADRANAPARPSKAAAARPGHEVLLAVGALAVVLAGVAAFRGWQRRAAPENPLADARFLKLTDFDGIEQAAALSRDGRFVAFQSDRDGRMDIWVTQVGSGQFVNLTRGSVSDLVNPSVRAVGFSPDGTLVTFWARGAGGPGRSDIGVWAVPLLGGPPRPYLEEAAEYDWSPDGKRLVYHTAAAGDPLFLREPGGPPQGGQIFAAPAGRHGHFPLWAADQAFLYLVIGAPPDHMDVWRLKPAGGSPERVTFHDSAVSHPVFLDARTLLYLATDPDGSGPWMFSLRPGSGSPRRASPGAESYSSLSASADGRRIVATVASPKRTLWRVPLANGEADMSAARRIALTTADGTSPRLGPGYLVYVSSGPARDSVWKLVDGAATELWSAPDARVLGAPALRRDGRRVALSVRQGAKTRLCVLNADGTDAKAVGEGLVLHGAPAWSSDGESLLVAAVSGGVPRLVRVPLDGRPAKPLLDEHSQDPVASPSGGVVVYSGPDVGTAFPVRALGADGRALAVPALTLTRGARHVSFTPDGRSLVILKGEIGHKDLRLVDLANGAERPLASLPADFVVKDFDLSPDGRELVLEREQQQSDLVLVERSRG
jgi:Tol biopolymer transport system component